MKTQIKFSNRTLTIDLSKPIDIAISLSGDDANPLAWYLSAPKITPVKEGDWIAKVSEGASVNFNSIWFNPHAHGTHTECYGHISKEFYNVNKALNKYFFTAKLISVAPEKKGEDFVISKQQLKTLFSPGSCEALIIRTLPNLKSKKQKNYNHSNWPYLTESAATYIREAGVEHLLIDLPSVDKEKDDGLLKAHRAFWNYPKAPRKHATITELIYVPNKITDGDYLLNLQIAPFKNDASPSKPILYKTLAK